MNCSNCKFFQLIDGDIDFGNGHCRQAPPVLFQINNQVESRLPFVMTDDPACSYCKTAAVV